MQYHTYTGFNIHILNIEYDPSPKTPVSSNERTYPRFQYNY